MTTRAAILARAFGRLSMGDYEFDVKPDERAAACDSLGFMLAEWAANGVDLGYVEEPGENDAVSMGTPQWADQAIIANLAVRIAADFGKAPGSGLIRDAKRGYDLAVTKTLAIPRSQVAQSVIHGGGQRFYRRYAF